MQYTAQFKVSWNGTTSTVQLCSCATLKLGQQGILNILQQATNDDIANCVLCS